MKGDLKHEDEFREMCEGIGGELEEFAGLECIKDNIEVDGSGDDIEVNGDRIKFHYNEAFGENVEIISGAFGNTRRVVVDEPDGFTIEDGKPKVKGGSIRHSENVSGTVEEAVDSVLRG